MDIATIIGIVVGVGLVMWAILTGAGWKIFVSIPSAMIVLGGTFGGTLVSFPLKDVLGVFKTVKYVFMHRLESPTEIIQELVRLSRINRIKGLVGIEDELPRIKNSFLKKGLIMVTERVPPDIIRTILERDIIFLQQRHLVGQKVFKMMGALSPAFGMIGTLIGLVAMLKVLDDPKKIGPGMAVALITTFYGALLANLFFIPMAEKLKLRTEEEVLNKEIIIEGVLRIQARESSVMVEEILTSFIAPQLRSSFKKEEVEKSTPEKKAEG